MQILNAIAFYALMVVQQVNLKGQTVSLTWICQLNWKMVNDDRQGCIKGSYLNQYLTVNNRPMATLNVTCIQNFPCYVWSAHFIPESYKILNVRTAMF